MKTRTSTPRPAKAEAAFTLAELLTVVAIITLLMTLSTAGWKVVSSMELTGAAESMSGAFSTARQHAVAHNRQTRVAFFREASEGKNPIRTYQVVEVVRKADGTDSVRGITQKFRLPESVMLDEENSPLVADQTTWEGVALRPNGQPRNPGIATGYLVLQPRRYAGDRPANYIVIQLNPLNGRTQLYQP